MAGRDFDVRTEGLREFRRDLKRLEPQVAKELQQELREAVGKVTALAAGTAPRKTGGLARSYRPFVTLRTAGIRSNLPYAPVIEYGGTIRPKGTPIEIRRYEPVTRAVERQADRIVNQFGDAVERAADKTGWH
jgi:phage gpG-like protein